LIVLRSIFQRYDTDHDGQLNEEEFGRTLDDLGVQDTVEHNALFALADSNNSKTVSFDDFLHLVQSNGFARILSSPKDYEFVITTYQTFQQYDQNGDGQITWDRFYWYLHSMGYSHQHITQYWYYMNPEQKSVISFEGFWKGFKAQISASSIHQLQNALNHQIKRGGKHSSSKSVRSKLTLRPSLLRSCSFENNDENNVFHVVKSHLKPTVPNKSAFQLKVGRVLDEDVDDDDERCAYPIKIQISSHDSDDSEVEEVEEEKKSFRHDLLPSMSISLSAAELAPLRLPDVMCIPQTPLHVLMPQANQPSMRESSLFEMCGKLSIVSTARDSNQSSNSSFLCLGYSPSPSTLSPLASRLSLPQFPSISESEMSSNSDSVVTDLHLQLSDYESRQSPSKLRTKKTKRKKRTKVKSFKLRPALQNSNNSVSDSKEIDRRSVLRPLKRNKYKHKMHRSCCL